MGTYRTLCDGGLEMQAWIGMTYAIGLVITALCVQSFNKSEGFEPALSDLLPCVIWPVFWVGVVGNLIFIKDIEE